MTFKEDNILGIVSKDYKECGFCKTKDKETLYVSWETWSRWLYINSKMGSNEWTGVYDVRDKYLHNFRLPKQEVSSGECEMLEDLGGNGVVHSHHNMGAFHSSQDDKHCRNLYEYSIVLTNNNGYEACRRIKLPCGGFGYVEVEIVLYKVPKVELDKIKERSNVITEYPVGDYSGSGVYSQALEEDKWIFSPTYNTWVRSSYLDEKELKEALEYEDMITGKEGIE